MKTTPWIERRFALDMPAGLFPQLVERLRGTPARVEDRVRGLSPEVLRAREGTTWSIQENVGHLLDVEALFHGRLEDYAAGRDILRAADLSGRRTSEADHNARPLREILAAFRESRMRLVARLDALDEAAVERSALHPRLNRPMRVIDMALFEAEHDDHHLARITELIRTFSDRR